MYTFITNRDSPNYTPANQATSVWGRPRTIEAIAIHHWGDPAQNPTFSGVVNWLCNPKSGVSAHFVATGTGRQVACIVDIPDASWATSSANPYTISIECDPRCRDEDYDVVAELIAELRKEYGNLPLVPHKQFAKTACPGNYDLARLDREARAKIAGTDFGTSTNPTPPTPPEPPKPTYKVVKDGKQIGAYTVEKNAYNSYKNNGAQSITLNGKDVTAELVAKYEPKPTPQPSDKDKEQDKVIADVNARLSAVEKVVAAIVSFLETVFKGFKKS